MAKKYKVSILETSDGIEFIRTDQFELALLRYPPSRLIFNKIIRIYVRTSKSFIIR